MRAWLFAAPHAREFHAPGQVRIVHVPDAQPETEALMAEIYTDKSGGHGAASSKWPMIIIALLIAVAIIAYLMYRN